MRELPDASRGAADSAAARSRTATLTPSAAAARLGRGARPAAALFDPALAAASSSSSSNTAAMSSASASAGAATGTAADNVFRYELPTSAARRSYALGGPLPAAARLAPRSSAQLHGAAPAHSRRFRRRPRAGSDSDSDLSDASDVDVRGHGAVGVGVDVRESDNAHLHYAPGVDALAGNETASPRSLSVAADTSRGGSGSGSVGRRGRYCSSGAVGSDSDEDRVCEGDDAEPPSRRARLAATRPATAADAHPRAHAASASAERGAEGNGAAAASGMPAGDVEAFWEALQALRGWQRVRMTGDGACLFRAVGTFTSCSCSKREEERLERRRGKRNMAGETCVGVCENGKKEERVFVRVCDVATLRTTSYLHSRASNAYGESMETCA